MPSLKDLRLRIRSVRSTQKITAAMKMVAGAKLRRAQEAAEAARPYADRMDRMLRSLGGSFVGRPGAPPMLAGTGKTDVQLVVVITADRGLCGSFNASIVRDARNFIRSLLRDGKTRQRRRRHACRGALNLPVLPGIHLDQVLSCGIGQQMAHQARLDVERGENVDHFGSFQRRDVDFVE